MEDQNRTDLSSLKINRDQRRDDRPRSKKWQLLLWLVAAIVIVAGYFLLRQKVSPATPVKIATVAVIAGSESQASLVASGYVVAQRKAEVASKGTGRLKYLGFEEGDTVAANEVIAELENEDIRANVELARANLLRAQADSLNTGRNFRRQSRLFETGSITEAVLEDAETGYKMAAASVAGAEASVKAAEVELENTYIRAPFKGTILSKNADVGEMVTPFASAASSKGSVVTLADMGSLEVEADVSEANIHKVTVGQRCDIVLDAYPNGSYPAYVKKIVPTADRTRATVLTKVAFSSIDDRVLPEMSARVNFFDADNSSEQIEAERAIAVDKDAVTSRDGVRVVFRIEGDYVQRVEVEIGRELSGKYEIVSGLTAGDRVVLSPPGKMVSGQKIEISN